MIPAAVAERTEAYLRAVDGALPRFVSGLYVVGSAALGAWQPGHSDVDTVVVTTRTPDPNDLVALAGLHAGLAARPHLDGVYVSPDDGWPTDGRAVPFVVDGEFHADRGCGDLNPVLWLLLQRYGVAVRGPAASGLGVRVDPDELRTYNLDNLRTYWQVQADAIRRHVADLDPATVVDAGIATWHVLGPGRLHYTLATGDIVDKSGAGEYVAQRFADHAPLALRAIRWRAGANEAFTARDLAGAAALIDLVAEDAWSRWG